MLTTDIIVDAECWAHEPAAEATIQRALNAAEHHLPPLDASVTVALVDDAAIRSLNKEWRGFDKPTNVLSFPSAMPKVEGAPQELGDIAIAYETLEREAASEQKLFAHHLSHLAVHGLLHLAGYDHETDDDAEKMEALERVILADLGIPDPYAEPLANKGAAS